MKLICGNRIVHSVDTGCRQELGDPKLHPDGKQYSRCLNDDCSIWGWEVGNNPNEVIGLPLKERPWITRYAKPQSAG